MFLGPDTLLTQDLGTAVGNFLGLPFIRIYFELLTGLGCTIQTQHHRRSGRSGFIFFLIPFIEHGLHPSVVLTTHDQVTMTKGTVFYQQGGYITTAFVLSLILI